MFEATFNSRSFIGLMGAEGEDLRAVDFVSIGSCAFLSFILSRVLPSVVSSFFPVLFPFFLVSFPLFFLFVCIVFPFCPSLSYDWKPWHALEKWYLATCLKKQ